VDGSQKMAHSSQLTADGSQQEVKK